MVVLHCSVPAVLFFRKESLDFELLAGVFTMCFTPSSQISHLFLFSSKTLHHAPGTERRFILALPEVNRRQGTRKATLFTVRPSVSVSKHRLAAQGTCTMSGHFSSQLWFNTGSLSIMGCCLWAHLWKSHSASAQRPPGQTACGAPVTHSKGS